MVQDGRRTAGDEGTQWARDGSANVPALLVHLDSRGTIVALAPPRLPGLGRTSDLLLNRHYLDLIEPGDRHLAASAMARLQGSRLPVCCTVRWRHPQGRQCWLTIQAATREEEHGYPGVVALIHDVTQNRRRLERLRRSNSLLRRQCLPQASTSHRTQGWEQVLEATSTGIAILRQGHLVFVNGRLARMTGYAREALLGWHWSRLFAEPASCPPVGRHRLGTVQDPAALVSHWRRADGTDFLVLYSLSPLDGADRGDSTEVSLSVLDVTQEAGDGLLPLLADDATMVHFADGAAALCLLDCDHRVVNVNRAFCQLFACSGTEVVGRRCQEIWGNQDCNTAWCPMTQLQAGAEQAYRVMEQPRCTLKIMPYRTASGRLLGTVVTFADTRQLNRMAAALVVARKQLVQAERLSTIGTMAGTMAHECNNALSGIRAVIDRMARKTVWTPAEQKVLRMSVDSCDRMHRLILEMQQCTQPFADDCQPLDLRAVLDAALALLRQYLQGRRVVVGKVDGGASLMIQGHADQLRQALRSLIRHQGKQFVRSGGHLQVRLWREAGVVCLELAASGIDPVAAESPGRISGTGAGNATDGPGLLVATTIIKAHGGRLLVGRPTAGELLYTVVLPECSVGTSQGEEHGTGFDSDC